MSIKQKQVLGVTSIVVLVVLVLSLMQLTTLTSTLLLQSRARAELIATAIGHRVRDVAVTEETAYQELRRDPGVKTALETALYSDDVVYAAIVDAQGIVVAHSDPLWVGERLPDADDLAVIAEAGAAAQLSAIYQTERMLEWRQPMLLDDKPIAEIRVALSTLLARETLNDSLQPALLAALAALLGAVLVAFALAQVVVRPIHVIRSGLSRLGKGDFGATLDLEGRRVQGPGRRVCQRDESAQGRHASQREAGSVARALAAHHRARPSHRGRRARGEEPAQRDDHSSRIAEAETGGRAQGQSEALDAHVDIISREIRRLDDVVQGFLKFARPEELTFKAVSPSEIVDEVLKTLAVEANVSGVKLESAVAIDVPQIEADPGIFRQALLNLAKNAVQAMPNGGTLTIDAAPTKDGRVEIRVSDTGVGIAPENLAKIFDLYFTTKPSGTGIGLSLVYRTVQLHNGDIDVESRPGARHHVRDQDAEGERGIAGGSVDAVGSRAGRAAARSVSPERGERDECFGSNVSRAVESCE